MGYANTEHSASEVPEEPIFVQCPVGLEVAETNDQLIVQSRSGGGPWGGGF